MTERKPIQPPPDTCPECGSERIEYISGRGHAKDEPQTDGGMSCYDCGHFWVD